MPPNQRARNPKGVASALALLAAVWLACPAVSQDRSVQFPQGWTSQTLDDCEQAPRWHDPVDAPERQKQFAIFSITQALEARAAGKASCRCELQPRADGPAWAQIPSAVPPIPSCNAISTWLKNPEGREALFYIKLVDADGATYATPAVLLGAERNWYEIAFFMQDYVLAAGAADPRPGLDFPITGVEIVLGDLHPDAPYVFYFDELRAHRAPPVLLDVVALTTPNETQLGEAVPVRMRLRARSDVPDSLRLSVGLALDGAVAWRIETTLSIPDGGAKAGAVLPAIEVRVPTSPRCAPGTYDVIITAENAEVVLPGPERLPTSRVKLVGGSGEARGASVQFLAGRPRIVIGGRPVKALLDLPSIADTQTPPGASVPPGSLARFRVHLGGEPGRTAIWRGPGDYDFAALDAAIRSALSAAPDAMLLPDVVIRAPAWWRAAHPQELAVISGEAGLDPRDSEPSFSSSVWRDDSAAAVSALVRHLEDGPFATHIAGYQLSAGLDGRWLSWDVGRKGLADYSVAQREGFQRWLRGKYGDLRALRSAWSQPVQPAEGRPDAAPATMSWAEIRVPTAKQRRAANTWLLDPITDTPVVDYRLFASDAIVDCIEHLSAAVKSAAGGERICGVAYGQFMELAARHEGLEQGGHLALARALELQHIDFVVGPPAGTHPGATLMPVASILRAGKAYLPGAGATDAWEAVAAGLEQAGIAGVAASAHLPDLAELAPAPGARAVAEVAVIVDDESAAYFGYASPVKKPLLTLQMDEARKMGAPVDVWLLTDLAAGRLPRYKLYVLLNAFRLTPGEARRVRAAVRRGGGTALWMCAPGALSASFNGRSMMKLTGIAASVSMGAGPLTVSIDHAAPPFTEGVTPPIEYGLGGSLFPRFDIIDQVAEVIGTDKNGRPALVAKTVEGATSIYSAAPCLPADLLRSIARGCGVHIYNDRDDRFYATDSLIAIHADAAGRRIIQLPERRDVRDLATRESIAEGAREFTVEMSAGSTRLFGISPGR